MISLLGQMVLSFSRVGLSAYGGGIAAIALIRHEVVGLRAWLTEAEFVRMVTIAEMTPGPLAVNTATFIGFRLAGVIGAVTATASVLAPALIILSIAMLLVGRIHTRFSIQRGVRPAVLALLCFAVVSFGRNTVTGASSAAIAITAFLVLRFSPVPIHPILVVLAGGIIGMVIY